MNYFGYIDGVYGIKTGFTCNAGRCLVSSCKRGNLDIIVVVLGAGVKKQRTEDSINLINYTYQNFEMHNFKEIIDETFLTFKQNYSKNIKIQKSNIHPEFTLSEVENYMFPIQKIHLSDIDSSIYTLTTLNAPIKPNTKIGLLQIKLKDNIILSLDVSISNSITKKSSTEYFLEILKSFSNPI